MGKGGGCGWICTWLFPLKGTEPLPPAILKPSPVWSLFRVVTMVWNRVMTCLLYTHTDWCMAILYSCALFILYSLIHGVFISHSRKWCKKKPKKLIHLKIYIFHKHGNPLVSWCLNYQNGDQAPGSCAYLSKDDHAWLRFKSDCSETSIAVLFLPWLFLFLLLLGTNQQDSAQLQLVMYDAMISNHTRYSYKQYETG